jgi:pimeloyl-ACP methyl ester carboxylesterase
VVLARKPPRARHARDADRHAPLTVDDVGDEAGVPVVYLHGGGDSRLSRDPDDTLAAGLGVRLLAVDRCGPAVRSRTLAGFAAELLALADDVGVERFAVVGWSAGGPHALAVAASAPERVTRVALVGSMPVPDGVRLMPRPIRAAVRVARVSPRLAVRGLERWGRMPPPPTGSDTADVAYARGRIEAFRGGGEWLARELAYLGRPWGFALADVQAPVTLWWGDADVVTPPAIAHEYARRLPHAELRIVAGTHQLLFQRWQEILADAARPVESGA